MKKESGLEKAIAEIKQPPMFTMKQWAQDLRNVIEKHQAKTKEDKAFAAELLQFADDIYLAVDKYEGNVKTDGS